LTGGERLAHLDVFYDFSWYRVFKHGRATFPHGQSLARLVRRDCPKGKTPTLLLTERDDVGEQLIETDDSRSVVVVPIHDYLAHSDPDSAASYYATRFGSGLTAVRNADWLATQANVVEAVIRLGLTIEDIKLWTSFGKDRLDQLKVLAGSITPQRPPADPRQVLELLRGIDGLDDEIVDGLAVLLGQNGDDPAGRLRFLRSLIKAALADEQAQGAFLRDNREFLTMILRSAVDAPDIVALAHRREVLARFERLLSDDSYFDSEKRSAGGSEHVWQQFIEEHPWVIGSAIAPQFLHSFSKERLEQTVRGATISGAGKRADALLRTAGVLSAIVLAEIKHHRTSLLAPKPYRPGCWRVSAEVAGGVAQCQMTADDTERGLGPTIDLKTDDGHVTGRAFVCRPRTTLIVGSLTEFVDDSGHPHHEKFASFERFRRGLRDPEILTFDELFERARLTLALVDAASSPSESD
jgi:hypothetical protein